LDAAKKIADVTVASPAYIVCKGGLRRYSPRRFGAGVPTEAEGVAADVHYRGLCTDRRSVFVFKPYSSVRSDPPDLRDYVLSYSAAQPAEGEGAPRNGRQPASRRHRRHLGGLIGKVAKVDDSEIQVELAEGVRVRVVRGSISEVRAKGEPVKDAG
jgi:hypothetical protein